VLEPVINGYTLTKSSDGTSLILEVVKTTPTITVPPTASEITYGQTLASSVLSGGTASVAGSFAFTTLTTAPSAGTASQAVTFTPTDIVKYNTASTTVSVTVNTKAITVTAAAKNKVYGQADPALTYEVTSGALVGSDSLTGSLSRAAGENVGSYAINSALANANYDVTFVPANLVIAKAAITVTADAGKSKKAGEADPVFTYAISSGSLVGTDALTGSLSRVAGEAVGTYDITQGTLAAGSNYDLTYTKASFEIQANGPTFASAFEGAGATAVGADGMPNLLRYAMGANSASASVVKPVSSLDANNLSITAIVRINDPKVSIVGQSGTSLSAWSTTPIAGVRTTDQTGATAGQTERQVFSVPRGGSKTFLRLTATLSN
jgi:hypothetical protein